MNKADGYFLARVRRGFTLIEVMISLFILAIGMTMVITVFPVGGEWTRQATETTISQSVAQNALSIIQSHYPSTMSIGVSQTTLQAFPNLTTTIPVSEMCYQYGSSTPCPADPTKATYFWTALVRATPGQSAGSSTIKYDLYILVFKKGSLDQKYTTMPSGFSEVPGVRGATTLQPTLAQSSSPPNFPPVDAYGIGVQSGTVFRQGTAGPRPPLVTVPSTEPIIIGVPADGALVSPLVYVYQTTLNWKAPPSP